MSVRATARWGSLARLLVPHGLAALSIRGRLVLLVVLVLLPATLFATFSVWQVRRAEWRGLELQARDHARALAAAVDRELDIHVATLRALATSVHLVQRDLAAFHRQAQEALSTPGAWVVLMEPDGRQLVNTLRPYGSPLPVSNVFPDMLQTVRPMVSNLFHGPVQGELLAATGVPVVQNGRLDYVLATGILPARLREVLLEQHAPADWPIAVADRTGTVVASTDDPGDSVGRPVAAAWRAVIATMEDGLIPASADGSHGDMAIVRSRTSGWSIAVEIPSQAIVASIGRSVLSTAAAGIGLLVLGALIAYTVGRRIALSAESLAAVAIALGRGERLPPPALSDATGIREIDAVRRTLRQAADALVERTAERRREAQILAEKNAELAELTHTLDYAPVMLRRLDGTIEHWNRGLREMYGWSGEEALGQRSHELLATNFPEPLESIDRTLQRRGMWRGELQHRRKDGSAVIVASLWVLHRDESGAPSTVIEVNADVTERRRAEATLRALYENAPTLMGVVELDGDDILHVFVNPATCRFFGLSADALNGHHASELGVPGATIFEWVRHYREAEHHGEAVRFEYRTPDAGPEKWLSAMVAVIGQGPSGRTRFCYVAEDTTERKRAEAALRASEERFRSTFEQAAVGMAEVALDGRWLRTNARLCEITGYPVDELTRLMFQDITHPADLDADLTYIRDLLAGEIPTYSMEKRYIRKDGSPVWVNLTVALVRDAAGVPRHFISVVEDISARKAAEAEIRRLAATLERRVQERTRQLVEANQELEAFAYSVSHDLRAPLRTMQGFADALLEDNGDNLDELGKDYAHRIVAGAARMDELIRDLLDYSRIIRAEITLEPVSLDRCVDEVLAQHRADIEAKGASIAVDRPLGRVLGQRSILTQAIANLLGNALKFVAPGTTPSILIRSEPREEGRRRLWVEDNGIGIASEHRDRIFHVFQRLHGAAEYPGTGIGLAIVHKGIERLGGTVGLESESGVGSHFWMELAQAGDA